VERLSRFLAEENGQSPDVEPGEQTAATAAAAAVEAVDVGDALGEVPSHSQDRLSVAESQPVWPPEPSLGTTVNIEGGAVVGPMVGARPSVSPNTSGFRFQRSSSLTETSRERSLRLGSMRSKSMAPSRPAGLSALSAGSSLHDGGRALSDSGVADGGNPDIAGQAAVDSILNGAADPPEGIHGGAEIELPEGNIAEVASPQAAVKWWEDYGSSVTMVRPVSHMFRSGASMIGEKATTDSPSQPGPSAEEEPAQQKGQGSGGVQDAAVELQAEESAVLPKHVHVVSMPRVMSMKTVTTREDSGKPCRVMAELYGVLVTGVPHLEKRKRILAERTPTLVANTFKGILGIGQLGTNSYSDGSSGSQKSGDGRLSEVPEGGETPFSMSPTRATAAEDVSIHIHGSEPKEESLEPVHLHKQADLSREMSSVSSEAASTSMAGSSANAGGGSKEPSLVPAINTRRQPKDRQCLYLEAPAPAHKDVSFAGCSKHQESVPEGEAELSLDAMEHALGDDAWQEDDMTPSHIPRRTTSQMQPVQYDIVASVFQKMFPNSFHCTIPVHRDQEVEKALFNWNTLSRNVAVAQKKQELWGKRPTVRDGGCCCFGGTIVDAEEFYERKVAEVEEEILEKRTKAWSEDATSSSFVLFYDQWSATVAAQSVIHPEDGHLFSTQPAPGPDDINWSAIFRSGYWVLIRKAIALPGLAAIILFPAGFFSAAIVQVNTALCATMVSKYCGNDDTSSSPSKLYSFISAPLIPSLLLTLWQMIVMPHGLYYLSLFQSDCVSQSRVDRKIARYFFMWGHINVFVGGVLGGMSEVLSLIYNPDNLLNLVGTSMVHAANFFIQFAQFQTLVIAVLALLQPHGGVWFYIVARILQKRAGGCCLLDRDVAMTWTAKSIRYGREIPIHLLIFLLGATYSVASPGILPYCAAYFAIFWIVRKYQVLYVYERCYESGGLFWPLVFDFILIMLLTFQVFMSAVFVAFGATLQAGLCFVTIPAGLYYFRRYCHKRFNNAAQYLPLEVADRAPQAQVPPELYIPPPLRNGAAGWHPESRKAWVGYGMASSTI